MQFHTLSSRELANGIKQRRFTAVAVLEHFLSRIERLNPALNAVILLRPEEARRQAEAADAAADRGANLGPLHGVPMTIKETFEIAGWPTTAGHGRYRDHVPDTTAPAVQRLLDAGAIVIGKTNVPELAGDLQSFNDLYGTSHNPWNHALTPGGSSGGAAAALAAGLTPLELGSDIGGSIRTPAAFCGVYGLKPTYGLVPTRGHIPGAPGSLAKRDIGVAGPMGRHLDDLEAALDLLAGPDYPEAVALQLTLPHATQSTLTEFRVAAWLDDERCQPDQPVRDGLGQVVESLRQQGVTVDESARPDAVTLRNSDDLFYDLLSGVMGGGLPDGMLEKLSATAQSGDPADYRVRFARGTTQSHAHWLRQDEQRARLQANWADFFRHYDVLLCPVVHTLPFAHDQATGALDRTLTINGKPQPYMDVTVWAGLAGIAGLPALSLPVGYTDSGLPLAVQIVGPAYSEKTLLAFGRLLDAVLNPAGLAWPPGTN